MFCWGACVNETEPPFHPESQAEVDGSPSDAADVSSDPVKPRSAIPGATLVCVNALLVVIWFVLLTRPTERASGQATPIPRATVTTSAVATDTVGLPPDATPTSDAMPTATAVRVANPPSAAPTATIPIPTPTMPAATPTPTPTPLPGA